MSSDFLNFCYIWYCNPPSIVHVNSSFDLNYVCPEIENMAALVTKYLRDQNVRLGHFLGNYRVDCGF